MTITDNEVLKELKKVRCAYLQEDIDNYPDDERDDRSDMQFFADEVSYILSNYMEEGNSLHEDLELSKSILNRTKYGKIVPLDSASLKPIFRPHQIQTSKDMVNEFNRLKNLYKRLEDKGFKGQWM